MLLNSKPKIWALGVGAVLFLLVSRYVWFVDVLLAPVDTLVEARAPWGDKFEVIQFWNRGDFYTAELLHTTGSGKCIRFVLDADCPKVWYCSLQMEPADKSVGIYFHGSRIAKYETSPRLLTLANGVSMSEY
jgi:hypothetical protein